MNKLAKSGFLATGTAVLCFGAAELAFRSTDGSFESHNQRVRACALDLGQVATKSRSLTAPCEEVKYLFPYQVARVTQFNPNGEPKLIDESITFQLPDKEEFLRENLADVDNAKRSNRKTEFEISGFCGLLIGFALLVSPDIKRKQEDDDNLSEGSEA